MNEVGNAHKKTRKKLDLSHLVCVFIIVLVLLALSPLWLTLIGLPFGAVPGPGLGDWRFHGPARKLGGLAAQRPSDRHRLCGAGESGR